MFARPRLPDSYYFLLIGFFMVSSCSWLAEQEPTYYAYCTCDHPSRRWQGIARQTRAEAERDKVDHNKKAFHCATVEVDPDSS